MVGNTNYIRIVLTFTALLGLAACQAGQRPRETDRTQRPTQRVVYTSQIAGMADDAQLGVTSKTAGTDQSARLQAVLNGGNVRLVVEGHYGLGSPLTLFSNTLIDVKPGCGFIARPSIGGPLFKNAHFKSSFAVAGTTNAPVDTDIVIRGGIFDGNRRGNAAGGSDPEGKLSPQGRFVSTLLFVGVEGLRIENADFYDSCTYGIWMHNVFHFRLDSLTLLIPHQKVNHDSIHFNGPASQGSLRNINSNADDDVIAFDCSDAQQNAQGLVQNPSDAYGGVIGDGPITDVTCEDVNFHSSYQGIRILTGFPQDYGDAITMRHLHGTNTSYAVLLDQYTFSKGLIKKVQVEDVDVRALRQDNRLAGAGYLPATIRCDTRIEDLEIRNLKRTNPYDNRSSVLVEKDANVRRLRIDGMSSMDTGQGEGRGGANARLIHILGAVGQLSIANVDIPGGRNAPDTLVHVNGRLAGLDVSDATLPSPVLTGNGSLPTSANRKISRVASRSGITYYTQNLFTASEGMTLVAYRPDIGPAWRHVSRSAFALHGDHLSADAMGGTAFQDYGDHPDVKIRAVYRVSAANALTQIIGRAQSSDPYSNCVVVSLNADRIEVYNQVTGVDLKPLTAAAWMQPTNRDIDVLLTFSGDTLTVSIGNVTLRCALPADKRNFHLAGLAIGSNQAAQAQFSRFEVMSP